MIDSYFLLESGKKHELQACVWQSMKKNKRNANIPSFLLRAHRNNLKRYLKGQRLHLISSIAFFIFCGGSSLMAQMLKNLPIFKSWGTQDILGVSK